MFRVRGARVHLDQRAAAMGACPRRGAWLRSVGLLGALALLALPRASGDCSAATLPVILHAHPEEYDADKTFVPGYSVVYKCDTGYVKLPGKTDIIYCQGVEWSKMSQFCDRSCGTPNRYTSMQLNATFINKNYFPINSTVAYLCRPGYTLSKFGPLISTCQDDATWSPVSESCKRKSCPRPEDLEHGQVHIATDILFGSRIVYSCDEGYTLIGDDTRNCEVNGNQVLWSGSVPYCKINNCVPPPNIQDGKHSGVNKDIFTYGEAVTYRCDSRGRNQLSLIGEATIFCDKDGEWNKPPPECKEVRCKTPKVDNAIQITGFGSFHTYKDTIDFECKDGYVFKSNSRITCEADNNWSPALPVCHAVLEPPSKEPPVSSHPGLRNTSQPEPPVSSQPGPPLPPNKEPQGLSVGIIIVIVLIAGIVLAIIGFILYRQYMQKGTYVTDEIHKEETHLNSVTAKEDTLMKERFT
ncbi:membrane cofactor protein-like isoform X1 [Vombatus ursinus]|uniref:Sushi domain-containing protein n=1 Tax=Vombatus ursinus TaxID=29139 RepID=A0A4X2L274_VOMUR|nr:membrane cofactor protein-like isoform X1 [Vombatus ursinus]XP_027727464.1 membrane cofactor protein-like isoform X1 [Vombatus ursinus]